MKTSPKKKLQDASRDARFLLAAAAMAAASMTAAAASNDGANAAKTHTLFMGADITVSLDGNFRSVQDVDGTSWVVDVDGHPKVISSASGPINIKITPSLKLTEISATVDGLKAQAGYSFGNDPSVRLTRALSKAAVDFAGYQAAINQSFAAYEKTPVAQGKGVTAPGSGPNKDSGNTPSLKNAASLQLTAAMSGPGSSTDLLATTVQSKGYDAMDVTFEVSAERRLESPYVVTVAHFRELGAAPGAFRSLVFAKALKPIDAHAARVHFEEDGFPAGFELTDFQLHLYNGEDEIATNVSSKRVELTQDDAFEYVKMDYIADHKDKTLPAVALMGNLPFDLPAQLQAGKYATTLYVAVSKDGVGNGAFLDRACTQPVDDPYLKTVVSRIHFKPALDKGMPVDGVASVKLGDLNI